ncbi:Protein phosphatase 2C [Micromonospora purpureochromogenes]|uniref:Protein phosphatase 2C n=2 Tax=Micromonospora purpureochromogenes TaxID=47872 RepID=A0A1C4UMC5_9ACTN|nr:Protein phosphatase 2C [Micromonospora purpureochromogenes]
MRVATASEAGNPKSPNEDWAMASESLIVVLDGATARTGTGCSHGIAWYSAKLGSALAGLAADRDSELANALMYGIRFTADQHRDTCDLSHPGTPSAATAMLRLKDTALEYLVLGDVTVLIDTADGIQVINQPGGYWVAAADPFAAQHAITGEVPLDNVRRVDVLTDGAARLVALFGLLDWPDVLEVLEQNGPTELIRRVRAIEAADPSCMKWARNKRSDDATAVYAA